MKTAPPDLENRRPLKSRNAGWAQSAAATLARLGASPDLVSSGAVIFALVGATAFVAGGVVGGGARAGLWVLAGLSIQARLICNLLDGLVAVEHGRGGPVGPIWNELPDRVADVLFLVGAGYGGWLAGSAPAETLGWLAAILAVLTAYIRELGRGIGLAADFSGPGAKPQRMAILTAAALFGSVSVFFAPPATAGWIVSVGLFLIVLLAGVTSVRRTLHAAGALRARATMDV